MSVRYPSLARRRQVAKHRDRVLREAVETSRGFVQEPVTATPAEPPPWPPTPTPGRVETFDLDCWVHPGKTSAAVGPFLVLCGICTQHPGHYDDADDAEFAQRTHYQKHYHAGETA